MGWAIVNGRVDTVAMMLERGVPVLDQYIDEAKAGLERGFAHARGSAEEYQQIIGAAEGHRLSGLRFTSAAACGCASCCDAAPIQ